MSRRWLVLLLLVLGTPSRVHADDDPTVEPDRFDTTKCPSPDRDDEPAASDDDAPETPVTWKEFELAGTMVDDPATVRALLAPEIERHHALTTRGRLEIADRAKQYGYHVVGIGLRETPQGTHAVIHLAPLPRVRWVDVEMNQSLFATLLEDEVRRRTSLRVGSSLEWTPFLRACELEAETQKLEDLLFDEGYYDARVTIDSKIESGGEAKLKISVKLGAEYSLDVDNSVITDAGALAIDEAELRDVFRHRGTCLLAKYACLGKARFRRAQLDEDVRTVTQMFRDRGYPEARVRITDDFDRRTKRVSFVLTVDQRRRLDVRFEGFDAGDLDIKDLRKQLTFNDASSSDDVEANESARVLTSYLQGRGYFGAKVTFDRQRFGVFDRLIYRLDLGPTRQVKSVDIRGNQGLSDSQIQAVIGTVPSRQSLFGGSTAVTSGLLAGDIDRIVDLYRRNGFRDARVSVTASTDPAGLDSAAISAALVSADNGTALHVRFTIEEGQPTLVTEVKVELNDGGDETKTPDERVLCRMLLRDLADLYHRDSIAQPTSNDRCIGLAEQTPFREDEVLLTRDQLRDRLFSDGRPRAVVDYAPEQLGPHAIAVTYKLTNLQELHFGKIVIRGNFRTSSAMIYRQLGIHEGDLLTQNALATATRNLRNMALFDAVNITMPDLDTTSSGSVNAVIDVTERYEVRMAVNTELGYSSYNGLFAKVGPSFQNLFGIGISLDTSGTLGFDLVQLLFDGQFQLKQLALEANLRFPKWLTWRLPEKLQFETNLTAFHRRQDTPRFGLLKTTGAVLSLTHTITRPRVGTTPARNTTYGVIYEFRSRERNIDAIRPIGADDDESQAPVTTRTGSIGALLNFEQRTDRNGVLQPLSPASGFRFEVRGLFATPYLLGQDTFFKVSATGTKYYSPTENLVLRADLRYDEGFPLHSQLLPEVERYFAGGDSTVRGYDDDRLKTEVVLVNVPPFDNVEQIRILPAGGNIRVMGSLDAQLHIWSYFATGVFLDAGMIDNKWSAVTADDIRPAIGMSVFRIVTSFGGIALERAIPLRPQLGDDPRGRWHLSFAARAQF